MWMRGRGGASRLSSRSPTGPSPAKPDTAATSPTISSVPDDPPALPTSHPQPPPPEPAGGSTRTEFRRSPTMAPVPAVPDWSSRRRRFPVDRLPVPPAPVRVTPGTGGAGGSGAAGAGRVDPGTASPDRRRARWCCRQSRRSPAARIPAAAAPARPAATGAARPGRTAPAWNFIQLRLIAPRKTTYRRCTPVVGVSVQVCVAQARRPWRRSRTCRPAGRSAYPRAAPASSRSARHAQLNGTDAGVAEVHDLVVGVAAAAGGDRLSQAGVVAVSLGHGRMAVVVLAFDLHEGVAAGHRALHAENDERPRLPGKAEASSSRWW